MNLGSVEIVAENKIKYNNKTYQAAKGEVPGSTTVKGNFLHGPQSASKYHGNIWKSTDGSSIIAPTYGPAYRGKAYIPRPSQVKRVFNGEKVVVSWNMPSVRYCSQCGEKFSQYKKKWYCQDQTICNNCYEKLYNK